MKKTIQIATMLLVVVSLYSCTKTEKVLVRKDGTWNIDEQTSSYTLFGVPTTDTDTDAGTVTFKDDGSGTIDYNDGTSDTFAWSVTDDVISVTYASIGETVDFDILDSSKDSQHWNGSYTYDVLGTPVDVTVDLKLSSLN